MRIEAVFVRRGLLVALDRDQYIRAAVTFFILRLARILSTRELKSHGQCQLGWLDGML